MSMKKIVTILLAIVMILTFVSCGSGSKSTDNSGNISSSQNSEDKSSAPSEAENESEQSDETKNSNSDDTDTEPINNSEDRKILVAYFSATNNTEGVAQKLADGLGADLYEITPSEPYTDEDLNYGNSDSRTSAEKNDPNVRPAISGTVKNMEQYDVVFIGYPIWWGEAPRIMSTFIESYDFSGKTVAPFCTSGSSEFGSSDSALRAAAREATWLNGHRFSAGASADDVLAWANSLGIS